MKVKKKIGRPKKYKPEFDDLAYVSCKRMGADDKDLCALFDVCESTLNVWKNDYPSFMESLKKGKDEYDTDNIENSLRRRAIGMTITETRINGGGDDDEAPAAVETTKEIPPDTTACIFWLKNRRPERWRDKQDVEHSGRIAVTHEQWLESLE